MRTAILALLLAILPLRAQALDTTEALGLVAMPLAVAAVSEATGVPAAELGQIVAALNQADVPPAEVIQIIRYVPVALVVEEERPQFVQFVRTQVDSGVRGTRLVQVIDDRLQTYGVRPEIVTLRQPATTFVLADDYVPRLVSDLDTDELLALITLPLAVDAAANLTGIDRTELVQLINMLNTAGVEPVRMVDVIRTAPVALINDTDPRFVQLVRTEVDRGVRGEALVTVIDDRVRTYDRTHPHGGPPGQLKKAAGVQTGAEIVHGRHPGNRGRARVVETPPVARVAPPRVRNENSGRGGPEIKDNRGKGQSQAKGKAKGQGKGKGKP